MRVCYIYHAHLFCGSVSRTALQSEAVLILLSVQLMSHLVEISNLCYAENGQQFNLQKRRGAALRSLLIYFLLSVLQKL